MFVRRLLSHKLGCKCSRNLNEVEIGEEGARRKLEIGPGFGRQTAGRGMGVSSHPEGA